MAYNNQDIKFPFGSSNYVHQTNNRGQKIIYENGQRVYNKPKGKIEDHFLITNVSWVAIIPVYQNVMQPGVGLVKKFVDVEMVFSSGIRENELRKHNKQWW